MCSPPWHTEAQCILPQLPARQQEPSALAAPGDGNPQEFPRPHLSELSWGSRRPSSKHRVPSAHFAQQPKQTNTRHRCSSDSKEIIDLQVAFLALLDAYALAKFITNIYSQLCCGLLVIFILFYYFFSDLCQVVLPWAMWGTHSQDRSCCPCSKDGAARITIDRDFCKPPKSPIEMSVINTVQTTSHKKCYKYFKMAS